METKPSRDIGCLTPVDDIASPNEDIKVVKRKILWGANGEAFDVSGSTPFPISVRDSAPDLDLSSSGNLTALNSVVTIDPHGTASGLFQILGTWVGTVVLEGSLDGSNWSDALNFYRITGPISSLVLVSSATSNGIYRITGASAFSQLRLRMSAYTSGTASIIIRSSSAPTVFIPVQTNPANLITGVSGLVKNTLPTAVSDGNFSNLILSPYGLVPISQESAIYARWGIAFSVTTDRASTGSAAQVSFMLISNSISNTKTVKIKQVHLTAPDSINTSTVFRFYMDPTVTAAGTALTAVGARQNSQSSATVTYTRLPTVSANGTQFATFITTFGSDRTVSYDLGRWVEPGHSMLITAQQSSAPINQAITLDVIEE